MSTTVKDNEKEITPSKEMKPVSGKIRDTQKMIEEVLDAYPEKSKKDRAKHLAANDPSGQCSTCQVKSNVKSRRYDRARLRICGRQGCGLGAGEGPDHGQPRPCRLRPVQLVVAQELL